MLPLSPHDPVLSLLLSCSPCSVPSPVFLLSPLYGADYDSLCLLPARLFCPSLHASAPAANYVLPDAGEFLDEVRFIELQREEADALIKQYNEEGRKAGPPPEKRFDNRQGGFRGGRSNFQRYDNRSGPQGGRGGGYQNRGGSGGGGFRGGKSDEFVSSVCLKFRVSK